MEQTCNSAAVEHWKERANAISATVREVASVEEALAYTLDLCASRPHHEALLGAATDDIKTLAAPGVPAEWTAQLQAGCKQRGLQFVESGLRRFVGGLEVGFAVATAGIAETGTCIVKSTDENVRLATMLPEVSVLLLPISRIVAGPAEASPILKEMLAGEAPSYTAYISGPSRTADVERVLTLGAHGPLEVHVLLLASETSLPDCFGNKA